MAYYKYQAGGPGQRPQVLSESGAGYCAQTGKKIAFFAPHRPLWIKVWRDFALLSLEELRKVPTRYCHGCGGEYPSTYASVMCGCTYRR